MKLPRGDREPRWEAIPKSRFCLWLFLSTEVMFFVALIGSYLVLRFGVPLGEWPPASAVGLVPWIGGVNTLILLASSVFMTRAMVSTSRNQSRSAKGWLIMALLLGTGFLAVKSYEYWEKFQLGLYPRAAATLVYPRYDAEYLAALQSEISVTRGALEQSRQRNPSAALEQQIVWCDRLALGLASWAGREYGQSDDPKRRELAIRSAAYLVRPEPKMAEQMETLLREERARLSTERDELDESKRRIQSELDQTANQLSGLASDNSALEQRSVLEQRLAEQRAELTAVNNRWSVVDDRLKLRDSLPDTQRGVNATFGFHLPIVVPGGRTWLYGYYLLTGVHAFHLLAGILVALALLPIRLDSHQYVLVGNVATYWNFVDGVWLVLFPIIYLL